MDMKKMGMFLKFLRKERNLTQEQMAQELGVSGRTVSRWETGRNLPDMDLLIELADFYGVDIRELLDGERKERPADEPPADTLRKFSDYQQATAADTAVRTIGMVLLAGFALAAVFMLGVLISNGVIVAYSVSSILVGLIAWSIPICSVIFPGKGPGTNCVISSLGFGMLSVTIQFFSIAQEARTGDWAAIEDTISVLCGVVVLFCIITLVLNIVCVRFSRRADRT